MIKDAGNNLEQELRYVEWATCAVLIQIIPQMRD